MGITSKSRATLTLEAKTSLTPDEVKTAIRKAVEESSGKAKHLGQRVAVERESSTGLELSVNTLGRVAELITMKAKIAPKGPKTHLTITIGSYKTSQEKLFFIIPAGPKTIQGMGQYRTLLKAVTSQLKAADSTVRVSTEERPG